MHRTPEMQCTFWRFPNARLLAAAAEFATAAGYPRVVVRRILDS